MVGLLWEEMDNSPQGAIAKMAREEGYLVQGWEGHNQCGPVQGL